MEDKYKWHCLLHCWHCLLLAFFITPLADLRMYLVDSVFPAPLSPVVVSQLKVSDTLYAQSIYMLKFIFL